MTPRALRAGWAGVAIALLLLLGYELAQWRALSAEGFRAAAERERLTDEIRLREQQLAAEMRSRAAQLRDLLWTTASGDPSAFLMRLAELAGAKRMKVLGVGPLERLATPQFTKSWHAVQVIGPYREIRELAARVERDNGILEDVRLELAPSAAGGRPAAADEVQARFRMTAVELSPAARKILDRVLAAGGGAPAAPAPGAAEIPPPAGPVDGPLGRDPFGFAPSARPAAVASEPSAQPPARPPVPLELSGIVDFPGSPFAIVNNQIVKVGDVVGGHRVEAITDTSVSLREPGAALRTIKLPELGAEPPAPPRR